MKLIRARGLLVGGLAFWSCTDDVSRRTSEPEVRDSANIRIVENGMSSRPSDSWQVLNQRIQIGGQASETEPLFRVVGAVRVAGGTIVVGNGGSSELMVFQPDGTFIRAVGGSGSGPGEFRAVSWVGAARDDSVYVWDRGLDRVSVFATDNVRLEYVRAFQPNLPENPGSQVVRGLLSDGSLVFSRGVDFIPAEGGPGVTRHPFRASVVSPEGNLEAQVGPFPGEAVFISSGVNGTLRRTPIPLGPGTRLRAAGERIYVAENHIYEIRIYDRDGELTEIVRRDYAPLPVGEADVQEAIESQVERLPLSEAVQRAARTAVEAVPVPESIPPIRSLEIDTEGFLWVEEGRSLTAGIARWNVFDPQGRWVGDVELDPDGHVLGITEDFIITLRQDEVGLESVAMIRIER